MIYEEHRASIEKIRNSYSILAPKPEEEKLMEDLSIHGKVLF
jgi:hypothetical protein